MVPLYADDGQEILDHSTLICKNQCPMVEYSRKNRLSDEGMFDEMFEASQVYKYLHLPVSALFQLGWVDCHFPDERYLDNRELVLPSQRPQLFEEAVAHLNEMIGFRKPKSVPECIVLVYMASFYQNVDLFRMVLFGSERFLGQCAKSHLLLCCIWIGFSEGFKILLEAGTSPFSELSADTLRPYELIRTEIHDNNGKEFDAGVAEIYQAQLMKIADLLLTFEDESNEEVKKMSEYFKDIIPVHRGTGWNYFAQRAYGLFEKPQESARCFEIALEQVLMDFIDDELNLSKSVILQSAFIPLLNVGVRFTEPEWYAGLFEDDTRMLSLYIDSSASIPDVCCHVGESWNRQLVKVKKNRSLQNRCRRLILDNLPADRNRPRCIHQLGLPDCLTDYLLFSDYSNLSF